MRLLYVYLRAAAALLPLLLAACTHAPAPVAGPSMAPSAPIARPYQPGALRPALLPVPGQRLAAARAHLAGAAPVPADTSAQGLAPIWADLRRRSYFLAADAADAAARRAGNAAQRLTAHLQPAACTLLAACPAPARPAPGQSLAPAVPGAAPAWRVSFVLRGIGRAGRLAFRPVAAPTLAAASDSSVRYQHGSAFATEYVNTPAGLRQNYYLARRPAGTTGSVRVELALATALHPVASADGQAVDFAPAGGTAPVLRYAGLNAWDATGRALPARLRLRSATALALEVDDAGATYPLTIDPLATTPSNALTDPANADYDSFGYSVAGAGDVNGDGFADLAVGAYGTANGGSQRGSAYVYYGSAAGLGSTAAGTRQTLTDPANANGDYFGYSVAGAGDVNGDGYADLVVGAYATANGGSQRGSAYVYYGSAAGLGTATGSAAGTRQTLTDPANANGDYFGLSVAGAGDVNGDGYADLVVGAYGTANGGSAYVYYGSAAGLGSTAGTAAGTRQTLTDPANADYDSFGNSVAGAGDVNGDGYADVLVGAIGTANGGSNRGSAYVYYGGAAGLGSTAGTAAGTRQTFTDPNNANNDSFGASVAGAGDVNGDGYADLVVGAYGTANGGSNRGSAYVYYGGAAGLGSTAGTAAGTRQTLTDPANANYDSFGASVAGAGDVNGDGYADLVVGAYGTANGGSQRGGAYVYYGGAAGLGSTAGTAAGTRQTLTDPANADYDSFGYSVAGAGDVNGDGYADLVVGAYGTANGGSNRGSAYVYYGSAAGLGSTAGTAAGTRQTLTDPANADFDYFGYSVAGAGDVNGDGYADLVVGAYGTANGGSYRGSAYVYYGSAAGLGSATGSAAGTRQRFDDPANADYDYFGASTAGAGDVNGDGYADLVVGAYRTANGGSNRGSAYLYPGNLGDGRLGGRLRLYNTDLSTNLTAGNRTAAQFGIGLTTRSVQGRVRARLVWEVAGNGKGFLHASPLTNSVQYTGRGPWTDLTVAGTELKALVNKAGRASYVRARLEYATASPRNTAGIAQPNGTGGVGGAARYGPWQYVVAQQLSTFNAAPLPVELSAFTATLLDNAAVRLAWTTASEKNSARFEVERSTDGVRFERLGTVAAAGSSNAPRAYVLLDSKLPAAVPTLYYRLRLLDLDGTASYSAVRSIALSGKAGFVLFPNPAHTATTLTGTAPGTLVQVFDALGRPVATATADATGTATLSLPTGLAAGVYVVRAGTAARRLVVE